MKIYVQKPQLYQLEKNEINFLIEYPDGIAVLYQLNFFSYPNFPTGSRHFGIFESKSSAGVDEEEKLEGQEWIVLYGKNVAISSSIQRINNGRNYPSFWPRSAKFHFSFYAKSSYQ